MSTKSFKIYVDETISENEKNNINKVETFVKLILFAANITTKINRFLDH
tara:strand:+ start:251 stop:397 length:147 start_codon:yes stop_codon:yes gene_type:complete